MKAQTTTKENLGEKIRGEILSWNRVSEQYSRHSYTTAFFANKHEFAHFHTENEIDVNYTAKVPEKILALNPVSKNPYSENWFVCRFYSEADAEKALDLVKKCYERALQ